MKVEFDPGSGRLTFYDHDVPGVCLSQALAWIQYRDESGKVQQVCLQGAGSTMGEESLVDTHGNGRQIVIHSPASGEGIDLDYRVNLYESRPFLLLQLTVRNRSHNPVYLDEICLCSVDSSSSGSNSAGRLEFQEQLENIRFFKVGWHSWGYTGLRTLTNHNSRRLTEWLTGNSYTNPATPRPIRRGEFWSEGWGILAGKERAIVAGFCSTTHQFGQVYTCLQPGWAAFKLVAQLDGVQLDPGESRDSDWGYLELVNLPAAAPEQYFIQAVARQMNARVPSLPPPAMWTHWYYYFHNISSEIFLDNLDGLASKSSDVPFKVTELDDGYQSAWGDWETTNARFPRGLEELAIKIKEKGFIPGLWLAPFIVESDAHITRKHPDWLVRGKQGRPIRAAFVYNKILQALDMSHPAVLEHIRQLMELITHRWGYQMVKADFLYAGALPGRRYNRKLTRAECLRSGLEAIRAGIGEETFLIASGCPFGPAIGVVDAMRIGPDTAPSWEPYLNWLPWTSPLIKKEPSMPSLRNALRHALNLNSLHQRWWWNDPDCLLARDQDAWLTESEVQSAVTLVGLSGGMLVSSDAIASLNPERLHWISLLTPNLGLRGSTMDYLENEMPGIFKVDLARNGQEWQLVGVFNWTDRPTEIKLEFARLGFQSGVALEVFDFWGQNYQSFDAPEIIFQEVPPHGCKLLRLCQASPVPHIVGDSLHISQGAEIASWEYSGNILSIETVDMGRKADGELSIWLPGAPRQSSCNGQEINIDRVSGNIFKFRLKFFGQGRIQVTL